MYYLLETLLDNALQIIIKIFGKYLWNDKNFVFFVFLFTFEFLQFYYLFESVESRAKIKCQERWELRKNS